MDNEEKLYDDLVLHRWWQIPYYWVGIKMYDLVAGSKSVKSSYYLSKKDALELFPMLRGDKLCGAIVYYDGWFACFVELQYYFFNDGAELDIK